MNTRYPSSNPNDYGESGAWTIDEDEEFASPLLRWNERVIAQVTGEEQHGVHRAYASLINHFVRSQELTAARRELSTLRALLDLPDEWTDVRLHKNEDGTYTAVPMLEFNWRERTADELRGDWWVDAPVEDR